MSLIQTYRKLISSVTPKPPPKPEAKYPEAHSLPAKGRQFHFVEAYTKLVAALKRKYPLEEAMDMAVGGNRVEFGKLQFALLSDFGLRDGMSLVDLGCGSGRTSEVIGQLLPRVSYLGIDVVPDLIEYARTKSPNHFGFICSSEFKIPLPDCSVDMVYAFSLFTHLLPEESYCYFEEAHRVLKPGGALIFSFLEFASPHHWAVFIETLKQLKAGTTLHLNMFLERAALIRWSAELNFGIERFIGDSPMGQSVCVMRK